MRVDQVGFQEQLLVDENLSRCPAGEHASAVENDHAVRDVLEDVELVRGRDDGFVRAFPLLD